jgi:hypothetical protein
MKIARLILHSLAFILCVVMAIQHPIVAVCSAILYAGAWLQPEARLGTATLITEILTGKIIKPLRTKVPELGYFSTDFGMTNGVFAPPVAASSEPPVASPAL